MKRIILTVVLLICILYRPTVYVSSNAGKFFGRTYHVRYSQLEKLYNESQYRVKNSKVIVTDEAIEAYLAGAFLKGGSPISYIHDHPPLGKYIIALSIIIFDNENTVILFCFALSFLGIFLISREVTGNALYSLIPVAIFANEPLMMVRLLFTPIPEIVQLPFVIFTIYAFLKYIQSKNDAYVLAACTSLGLGAVISTRFFVLGAALLLSQLIFLAFKKRYRKILIFALTLPLSIVVLELSYLKVIFDSHSIIKPISVQKYILAYHSSKFIQTFTVWDLLLFNRWHTWWGKKEISTDPNWIILWPISVFASFALGALGVFKKIKLKDQEWVLLSWVLCYGLVLSAGYASVRYFLPWVPFFYILALSLLYRVKIVKRFFSK